MNFTLWMYINIIDLLSEFLLLFITLSILYSLIRLLKYSYLITSYKVINNILNIFILLIGISSFIMIILNYYSISLNNSIFFTIKNIQGYLVSTNIKETLFLNNSDLFGFILLFLGNYIAVLSKSTLDSRIKVDNLNFIILIFYFNITLIYFINAVNFIEFFIFYESLLLPSFLIIYLFSYSRRVILASIYFLIWTQIGSLLILISFTILINVFQIDSFQSNWYYTGNNTIFFNLILNLLILGFGVKVPIWPFHYWITKTHVEAPTGFSIYLSGFLVKTAVFGIYKTLLIINIKFNLYFFLCIVILGFIDSSFKFWGQTDLKKLTAYCTIQEMNLILLLFIFGNIKIGNASLTSNGFLFIVTHALLSSLMFFIVDCIYRRFSNRDILIVNGLMSISPKLSYCIIAMIQCFIGLPGTAKFLVEFNLLTSILEKSLFGMLFLLMIINIIAVLGFSKIWYNSIFGIFKSNISYNKENIIEDLTMFEFIFIFSLIILQLFFTIFYFIIV